MRVFFYSIIKFMNNLFTNIITIDDFKDYQGGWSENFEDKQIQDAINIATNDLNAYTNFLLERVYVYNTGDDVQQSNPLWRNELEMKALKMSVLSQTYYKLMNGNDNSIGDASFSGAGVSLSQSLPERNYIAEDVLQWLINARLINNAGEKKPHCVLTKDIVGDDLSQNPLEIVKRPYPDPVYVPSKFLNFLPENILTINSVGNVVQSTLDEVMKNWTIPEETITYIEEYVLSILQGDIETLTNDVETLKGDVNTINENIETINTNIETKANLALDNVNVGEGKEDKLLSFNADGTTKFVEQSSNSFSLNYLGVDDLSNYEADVNYKLTCDGMCVITFQNRQKISSVYNTIPINSQLTLNIVPSIILARDLIWVYRNIILQNEFVNTIAEINSESVGSIVMNYGTFKDNNVMNYSSITIGGNEEIKIQSGKYSDGNGLQFDFKPSKLTILYYGTSYTPINTNATIYKELNENNEIIGLYHESALPKARVGRNFQVSTLEERNEYRNSKNNI